MINNIVKLFEKSTFIGEIFHYSSTMNLNKSHKYLNRICRLKENKFESNLNKFIYTCK